MFDKYIFFDIINTWVKSMNRIYACIDLKSFYASVECVERNLDPLCTNLVVADNERTEKTICLAITPSLKQYGLKGRARLYEVIQRIDKVNYDRKRQLLSRKFTGKSYDDNVIKKDFTKEIDYIIAPPRMGLYMSYSTKIYNIYLKYISSSDIYVYSIDEVFCDITSYLSYYKMTPKEFISMIIKDVYSITGITATAGIGTNMYLAKIAMDIVAKHSPANEIGVRISELDEMSYRRSLWNHQPLTDFWRVGKGYAKRLESNNMHTMGDVARMSINNEDLLYKLFGVNAEILIDHAWGYEPCTMKDIKSYKPESTSIGSSQVLHCPYTYVDSLVIVKEMADLLALDLVKKHLVTNKLTLVINYDISNINKYYNKEVSLDNYGRCVPKPASGSININHYTSSSELIRKKTVELYETIVDKSLLIRKIGISLKTINKDNIKENIIYEQFDLFSDSSKINKELESLKEKESEEEVLQQVVLNLKNRYGKNAVLKGMNLESAGTTIERNKQVGGHRE